MKYKQYKLRNIKTNADMVTFLDNLNLKIGNTIRLKDEDEITWQVEEIYTGIVEEKDIKGGHTSKNWYKKDYLHKIGNR